MASTNQSPFYKQAEANFLQAQTNEEKLMWLEEMIKECPKHKSSEKMLANLKTRHIKLKEKISKSKKSKSGSSKEGIKKLEAQAIIVGFENTGKSTIFQEITNAKSLISEFPHTTMESIPGTAFFEDAKIQIIDTAPFPNSDFGIINNADVLIPVIDHIKQLGETKKQLNRLKTNAKQILVFNKSDLLSEQEKRKISATLNSKKQDFVFFSSKTKTGKRELLEKIWQNTPVIRIYTKEPKKPASKEPMLLKKSSTTLDVAEKIIKGMSKKIKRTKIWGPSAKFQGQVVGLNHILKDKDIVEFQTN